MQRYFEVVSASDYKEGDVGEQPTVAHAARLADHSLLLRACPALAPARFNFPNPLAMLKGTCKTLIPSYADLFATASVEETLKMLADLRKPLFAFRFDVADEHRNTMIRFDLIAKEHVDWTLLLFAANHALECAPLVKIAPQVAVKNTIVTEVIAPAACIKIFNNDTGMPLRVVEKMPDSIFVRTAGYDTMVYFAGEVPPIHTPGT